MRQQRPKDALRDVGRRIAELRASQHLTQEQLAEVMEVSLKYLQRVEAGRENLTLNSLVNVANYLRTSWRELTRAPRSRVVRRGRPPAGGRGSAE